MKEEILEIIGLFYVPYNQENSVNIVVITGGAPKEGDDMYSATPEVRKISGHFNNRIQSERTSL